MKRYFADACYWIALLHRHDQLHVSAVRLRSRLKNAQVVTTDEVLSEVLNFFSGRGKQLRLATAQVIEAIYKDGRVSVVEQSRTSFDSGFVRYKRYSDKEWSIVDCISFELMCRDGLWEALTNDHHFEQAGFKALMRASAT